MTEQHVAAYLNLNPSNPLYWPIGTIRRLIELRANRGHERFLREIIQMMAP